MSIRKIITHHTPANGNVFSDLGLPHDEAARLLAEADQAIEEKRAMKKILMTGISEWIDSKNLTQGQAAEILGVTRPRISDVVNKKTPKFTIDALLDMVMKTGKHVHFSIR